MIRKPVISTGFVLAVLLSCVSPGWSNTSQESVTILRESGFSGGFIVHLGPTDLSLTEGLRQSESTQVHALMLEAAQVAAAREKLNAADIYGDISIDLLSGRELPYVDNLVNLLLVEDPSMVAMSEAMRVLVPGGVVMIRQRNQWKKEIKPWPDNIDEWSHYLHDASGNSVAQDDVVGPPRHLQWVGSPRWSRHHDRMASMSALVSSGGRMFYIMDEGSRISIQLPSDWKLIARDAFNGSVLWKRDIPDWQSHLWSLKSGPNQLARRLVSSDNTLFVTMGFNAPVSAIDAVTGEDIRVYEGSDATEEIIHTGGMLFVVVRKQQAELQDYTPIHGRAGDQAHVRENYFWNEEPCVIMAYDVESGKQLWAKQASVSPLTLSADDSRVFFHDAERVVCLNQKTGEAVWESEPLTRRKSFNFNFGPRLVSYDDVMLFAGGDGKLTSIDKKSGQTLWESSFPNSGYQWPQDLMVVGGLVWLAPLTSGKDSGVYTGRDPRTGEIKKQFAPNVDTYWFHHRLTPCVIADATVYVARVDTLTLYALDETDGRTKWTYTIGGRIDSPPTIHRGRVLFGGVDGWVYCLTAGGELVWRDRAAPLDRRTMAYEQIESLWPVHGSVLVHNDNVYCVARRSIFLDGGLRLLRLDVASGEKLSETLMDEKNPETGNNIQEKI